MLIDRKHFGWGVWTAVLIIASVAVYLIDTPRHASGRWGSTPAGITLGSIALALMVFCAALGLRRRVTHWRIGRAQTWLRAHLWLGLFTAVLVFLHADFHWGGPLTITLWILLIIVTVSGVLGVGLQQMLPSLLLHGVKGETVYQQIDRAITDLPELGEGIVKKYAGSLDKPAPPMPAEPGDKPLKPPVGGEPLRRFYLEHVAGFLRGEPSRINADARTTSLFASLRTMTPPHIHAGVDAIEQLCHRRLELKQQRLIMRVLLGWLLFHVPVSWVLLVLAAVHAVTALRYG